MSTDDTANQEKVCYREATLATAQIEEAQPTDNSSTSVRVFVVSSQQKQVRVRCAPVEPQDQPVEGTSV